MAMVFRRPWGPGLLLAALSSPVLAQAPVVDGTRGDLDARLTRVERLVDSQGLLEILNQVQALQTEVQRLRGEVEVQSHTLEQIRQRQRDLYVDVDRRLQRLEGTDTGPAADAGPPLETLAPVAGAGLPPDAELGTALTVETQVPAAAPLPAATAPAEAPVVDDPEAGPMPDDVVAAAGEQQVAAAAPAAPAAAAGTEAAAEAAYRDAFQMLKAGRYEQSITAFNEYLGSYPGSANADNAQYWLGEAHYVMRRFEPAIQEYKKLVANYPNSQKLTHALLKVGYSYHELGQVTEAKRVLEDLRARYPGTTAARLAEERLQRISLEQS